MREDERETLSATDKVKQALSEAHRRKWKEVLRFSHINKYPFNIISIKDQQPSAKKITPKNCGEPKEMTKEKVRKKWRTNTPAIVLCLYLLLLLRHFPPKIYFFIFHFCFRQTMALSFGSAYTQDTHRYTQIHSKAKVFCSISRSLCVYGVNGNCENKTSIRREGFACFFFANFSLLFYV